MKIQKEQSILGIEGGGTKTTWAVVDQDENVISHGKTTLGNIHALNDAGLHRLLLSIRKPIGPNNISAIGGAFAGCHVEADRRRLTRALKKVWPSAKRIAADEDIKSAFYGAHKNKDGICLIAGTGANVFGKRKNQWEKVGGWGHIFADKGSAYDLARSGLERVYRHYDQTKKITILGHAFLEKTKQKSLENLVGWSLAHSSKKAVADLAFCVFEAAQEKDKIARKTLKQGAQELVDRVGFIAKRLKFKKISVGLVGGLFEHDEDYFKIFSQCLRKDHGKKAKAFVNHTPGEIGASRMISLFPE